MKRHVCGQTADALNAAQSPAKALILSDCLQMELKQITLESYREDTFTLEAFPWE